MKLNYPYSSQIYIMHSYFGISNRNESSHSWVCDNPHSYFQVMEPHIGNPWLPWMGMDSPIHGFVIIHIPTFPLSSYETPHWEPLTPMNGNGHSHSWVCDNPHSHFQVMEPHLDSHEWEWTFPSCEHRIPWMGWRTPMLVSQNPILSTWAIVNSHVRNGNPFMGLWHNSHCHQQGILGMYIWPTVIPRLGYWHFFLWVYY